MGGTGPHRAVGGSSAERSLCPSTYTKPLALRDNLRLPPATWHGVGKAFRPAAHPLHRLCTWASGQAAWKGPGHSPTRWQRSAAHAAIDEDAIARILIER